MHTDTTNARQPISIHIHIHTYINMYAHKYRYTHPYTHTHMYTKEHTHTHMYTHMYTHAHMYTNERARAHTHTHKRTLSQNQFDVQTKCFLNLTHALVFMRMSHICQYTRPYTHTCTHTCTQTSTYTHTHTNALSKPIRRPNYMFVRIVTCTSVCARVSHLHQATGSFMIYFSLFIFLPVYFLSVYFSV